MKGEQREEEEEEQAGRQAGRDWGKAAWMVGRRCFAKRSISEQFWQQQKPPLGPPLRAEPSSQCKLPITERRQADAGGQGCAAAWTQAFKQISHKVRLGKKTRDRQKS